MRAAPNEGRAALPSPVWYALADDHSVVELRPTADAAPTLALHVVIDGEADATVAWWETENGMWVVLVGQA
ncbi:MAG TPA: hypothetical protein VGM06_09790 [Polyangiaceae bacterium]